MSKERLYGYLLEFTEIKDLLSATKKLVDSGYRRIETFTPFPIKELDDILPASSNPIPALMFVGGLVGAITGYGIQYYTAVIDFPILVGGKPMHSWPAFVPVTFELMVLFSAIAGFLGALWSNGLPRLHHPVFDADDFNLASRDRFFLLLEARDERFDPERSWEEISQIPGAKVSSIQSRQGEM